MAVLFDPSHWVAKAQEARTIADRMTDAEARRLMLVVADSYEELAQRSRERLAKSQDPEARGSIH